MGNDMGTDELRRHAEVVTEDRDFGPGYAVERGARVVTQRLIDTLLRRKHITDSQYQSADRLFQDFHMIGMSARVVSNLYGATGGGGMPSMSNAQANAHRRLIDALRALTTISRQLVIGVVLWDEQPSRIVGRSGFSADFGMPRFREALDDLSIHYGIAASGGK